ncbi:MAG: divergent polysaccharide deacetylase family protein [Alphaproteobacteria bacterium]|nr:divergent polysaccharide deacetylase family protein [Alphaproteobacteria bacterium]
MNIPTITALQDIDRKSLGLGLALVAGFYLCLYFYALIFSSGTYDKMESVLATQKVLLYTPEDFSIPESPESADATHQQDADKQEMAQGALIKSPVSGLFENTDYGKLPILRQHDGMTSFNAYRRPPPPITTGKPAIAFLLTDFGLSPKNASAALETLPPEISLLLTPYAQSPETWREMARKKGHETWLDIAIENKNIARSDPGPAALLVRDDVDSNRNKLYWSMARTTGYVGLASFTDDSFLMAQKNFRTVYEDGLERGLAYLELNPSASNYLQTVTLKTGSPELRADLWVYQPQGENSFEALEKIARQKNFALGVMPAYPQNIKMLELWLKTMDQKGFTLIPVSAIADLQKSAPANSTESLAPHHLDRTDQVEPEIPSPTIH